MEVLTGKPPVIRTGNEEGLRNGLDRARQIILTGGLVAFPTESFYGLAVNASDEDAIRRLFKIKKRLDNMPVLVLIPSLEYLKGHVADVPEIAFTLIEKFWPGGLTLLFKAGSGISPLLTAGTAKIGVRVSSHPVAAALTRAVGLPITGTSANISGRPGCVTAEEVYASLGNGVDLILDGGRTAGGKGSTILDVTVNPPEIIREGMVSHEQLQMFYH
ncbi:MAG TPA: L-threonylcarbamoyladenylate synthase [Desulfatiglandales bacterium]|nr:L-threonylcarbamoyladenylate synthase [Desulfatiglandales bacterium]